MAASAFRVIVVIVVCFLAGCARKPILVVTVGGLGYSQMGDVRRAVDRRCPKAKGVSAGWWDADKSDLPRIIRKSPHDHLGLIGHSFGCQTVAQAARKVSKVDLVVFIDPAWNDIRLPRNVERCLWYRRSDLGLSRRAKVRGASPVTIEGGHNEITESKELIAGVVKAINGSRVHAVRRQPGRAETDGELAAPRAEAGWTLPR